jgi:hypothetical protein
LTKESFGNEFRKACKAAGVPGSAHGVRKIAAEIERRINVLQSAGILELRAIEAPERR